MAIDRDEIKRRVRRALESELGALPSSSRDRSARASTNVESSTPPSRGHASTTPTARGDVVTEREVADWVRGGRTTEYPPETRFTPLARDTYDRELQRRTLQHRTPGSGTEPRAAGPRDAIAVGADHGGYSLKEQIKQHLTGHGFEVLDCGTDSTEACDYPVFARAVAERVRSADAAAGIVVDGAGIGSAMAANKVPGIRAAHCHSEFEARNAREHNHAHVLTLGAGVVGKALALAIVDAFLATPFGEGRHARRVAMIDGSSGVSRESASR